MRSRPCSDALRGRPGRAWAFDAAVTLAALLFAGFLFLAAYAVERDEPPAPVGLAVLLAMVAPLPLRRVWPLPTFAVVLAVAVGAGWWAEHLVLGPPLVITLYTVATHCPRRVALSCAAALSAGVVAWASQLYPDGRSWLSEAVSLVVAVVAVTALGLYVATRRSLLAELRERAVRLERERDRQGQLAAAAERARIAREMHDIVAHHLTVMVSLADGAVAQSGRAPERAAEAMTAVAATGREALADTRRLLGVLRDASETGGTGGIGGIGGDVRTPLPTLADLDDLVTGVRAAGLSVRYEVDGPLPALDPVAQLALYRLVQESMTNTLRHAGAARATVRIAYRPDVISVSVVDDGNGGVTDAVAGRGLADTVAGRGLAGMRERLSAVGGEVEFGPRPAGGWAVRARLPVPQEVRT